MAEIIALLSNISQVVTTTELRQLLVIVPAVLAMTGQVTMLNTSCWTGKGGSYPTIRRFYNAQLMWLRLRLHLISKLAKNSALYFPYTGEQHKSGARRKYGTKVDYQQLPARYLKQRIEQDGVRTEIYQMHLLTKPFPDLLNVVILVKTQLDTQERAHVVLFSSDLELNTDSLILIIRVPLGRASKSSSISEQPNSTLALRIS
ncbi:MAG: hypothetical protein R3C14_45985 [Caldilineaceae bacterium]